ncbi:hypothetical protein SK128_015551 [Halocaridina rubra]|uniref:Uncharacterized protein n=1 Tax=Halocaridina rubra TaxID=373956 RepID=A0AAN8WZD5_HALRR
MVMNDSVSSLTEHIRMLSSILPYERQYVNYSFVEDLEEKIECPEDNQPATTTTAEISTASTSTTEVSTASTSTTKASTASTSTTEVSTASMSTTEVSTTSSSTTPSSSLLSTVISSTSTETSGSVSTTSVTTTSPTTSATQTTTIIESTSEGSSPEIPTEYTTTSAPEITSRPSSFPTIPILKEDKEENLIEVDQAFEIDCEDDETQNSTQVIKTFHLSYMIVTFVALNILKAVMFYAFTKLYDHLFVLN